MFDRLNPNQTIAHLLWDDCEIYQQRYQKSVVALTAIRMIIREHQQFAAFRAEFEAIFQAIQQVDAAHFTTVWSDPAAQHWLRVTYELIKAILANQQGSEFLQTYCTDVGFTELELALLPHLQELNRFVLAMYYLAGQAWQLPMPYRCQLPMVWPGTPLYIDDGYLGVGSAQPTQISISAITPAQITYQVGGVEQQLSLIPNPTAPLGEIACKVCPVAHVQAYELPLQPYTFQIPGLGYAQPVLAAESLQIQACYLPLVEQSLALIQQFQPQTYGQMTEFVKVLALKHPNNGSYTNISDADVPGAFICSIYDHPLELADTLIHEFHHNRLFFLEDRDQILSEPGEMETTSKAQIRGYYSPWRDDLRPLRGLLHATYVYTPVWHYWYALWQSPDFSEAERCYISSQVGKIGLQLQIGRIQLQTWARFTAYGQALFDQLVVDILQIQAKLQQSGLLREQIPALICQPDGSFSPQLSKLTEEPLNVQAVLTEHIQQFDLDQQVPNLIWL